MDERIATRTNPSAARQRAQRDGSGRTRVATNALSESRPNADAFDGRSHPELFLPHEVFRYLLHVTFLSSPRTQTVFRESLQVELVRTDLPPDFWNRLESISTIYVADLAADHDVEICRSGATALAAARREFGPERFDRFLYESIASKMFYVADKLPEVTRLRDLEEGCR